VKLVGGFDPPLPPELSPHHLVPVLLREQGPGELPDLKKTYLRVQP
jgi:hypothetical protein